MTEQKRKQKKIDVKTKITRATKRHLAKMTVKDWENYGLTGVKYIAAGIRNYYAKKFGGK